MKRITLWSAIAIIAVAGLIFVSCSTEGGSPAIGGSDAASQVYVAPGEKDLF